MTSTDDVGHLYDTYYFRYCCGRAYERTPEWLDFFGKIADEIVKRINPKMVLDVGCAMGFLVEGFRDRGLEAFGIDISEYALEKVRDDLKPYCRIASILDPITEKYDLIVCIEVLEHLPPEASRKAIENLCLASDDIIFSSTPYDYGEVTHNNVQPLEYWAELFALCGFIRDVDFDVAFITPWATRYRRNQEPFHRIVRDYERKFWYLWKENVEMRALHLRMQNQLALKEQDLEEKERNLQELRVALEEKKSHFQVLEGRLVETQGLMETLKAQLDEKAKMVQSLQENWEALTRSRTYRLIKVLPRLKAVITGKMRK